MIPVCPVRGCRILCCDHHVRIPSDINLSLQSYSKYYREKNPPLFFMVGGGQLGHGGLEIRVRIQCVTRIFYLFP
ncbi:hypothetical protein MTBBW1_1040061 [Desulfamplus magnetovallimortis]|uniref:Uncharacterized protein n=1 Tax=Desulfamplus magnetovallimortis TaxID=1246637 RepID=A0A1W1H578_9BACT|nr:hypothetical protein MTBBW1_1040061 [Desulfamplus magnetovallimortis]